MDSNNRVKYKLAINYLRKITDCKNKILHHKKNIDNIKEFNDLYEEINNTIKQYGKVKKICNKEECKPLLISIEKELNDLVLLKKIMKIYVKLQKQKSFKKNTIIQGWKDIYIIFLYKHLTRINKENLKLNEKNPKIKYYKKTSKKLAEIEGKLLDAEHRIISIYEQANATVPSLDELLNDEKNIILNEEAYRKFNLKEKILYIEKLLKNIENRPNLSRADISCQRKYINMLKNLQLRYKNENNEMINSIAKGIKKDSKKLKNSSFKEGFLKLGKEVEVLEKKLIELEFNLPYLKKINPYYENDLENMSKYLLKMKKEILSIDIDGIENNSINKYYNLKRELESIDKKLEFLSQKLLSFEKDYFLNNLGDQNVTGESLLTDNSEQLEKLIIQKEKEIKLQAKKEKISAQSPDSKELDGLEGLDILKRDLEEGKSLSKDSEEILSIKLIGRAKKIKKIEINNPKPKKESKLISKIKSVRKPRNINLDRLVPTCAMAVILVITSLVVTLDSKGTSKKVYSSIQENPTQIEVEANLNSNINNIFSSNVQTKDLKVDIKEDLSQIQNPFIKENTTPKEENTNIFNIYNNKDLKTDNLQEEIRKNTNDIITSIESIKNNSLEDIRNIKKSFLTSVRSKYIKAKEILEKQKENNLVVTAENNNITEVVSENQESNNIQELDNNFTLKENTKVYRNMYDAFNNQEPLKPYFNIDDEREAESYIYLKTDGNLKKIKKKDNPNFEVEKENLENSGAILKVICVENEGYFRIEDIQTLSRTL